jgi:hypothetical protein
MAIKWLIRSHQAVCSKPAASSLIGAKRVRAGLDVGRVEELLHQRERSGCRRSPRRRCLLQTTHDA